MTQNKTILSLTMDLLANNAFSHLRDDEISSLHHLILKVQQPVAAVQQGLLLNFWHFASTVNIPAQLLYNCNIALQQLGQKPLDLQDTDVQAFC